MRRTVQEFKEYSIWQMLNRIAASKAKQLMESICQEKIETEGKLWICITCLEYSLVRLEKPRLCLANGLRLPKVDDRILALNDTEERLCSPRIAFLRIIPLKWDRQKGLRGNVVNVPVDVNETVQMLPRDFSASKTIQVNLKRRIQYK